MAILDTATNPALVRTIATANRIPNSTQVAEQSLEELNTPVKPIESSLDIYSRLQGKTLTPEQKDYYFNNTKDIIAPLNLAMPDEEINSYLNNNDLRGLDSRIVAAYNEKYMLKPMDVLNIVFGDPSTTITWKQETMHRLYTQLENQKPLTLDQIANLRSDITGQTATVNEPAQISKRLSKAVSRANRAGQSMAKYQKQLNDRQGWDNLNTVGDLAELMGVGSTWFRTILTDERLSQIPELREAINPLMSDAEKWVNKPNTSLWEDIGGIATLLGGSVVEGYYSVMRGSNLQRLSEAVNNLSDENYNRFWDLIDNDPFLNDNLIFKGELISGIMGESNLSAYTTNVLELANTLGTPKQLSDAGKAFTKEERERFKIAQALKQERKATKQAVKEAKREAQKTGNKTVVVKDLDYTNIPINPPDVPTPEELKHTLTVKEIASDTDRYRMLGQAKQLPDGTWVQEYTYLDTLDDVIAEMKKNTSAVFEVVPSSDTREAGKHTIDMMTNANKKHQGLYPEFSLTGNWDIFKEKLRASAEAYAAGANVQGDLNAGATQRAAGKLSDKIKAGEDLNPTEQFAMLPEISAGAKRNTPAIQKVAKKAEEEKKYADSLEKLMIGSKTTPKDVDPQAFANMEAKLSHDFTLRSEALVKEEGVDLKFSKVMMDSETGQGIEVKEIMGFGRDNLSPIKGMTKEEALNFIKGSGFGVEVVDGDTVLTRTYFVPYNSLVATKLDDANVGTISPYLFSIKSSGLDPISVENVYRARALQGGLKGYLTERMVKPFNKLTKNEKKLMSALYREEWLKDALFTQEEVYERLGGATKEAEHVWNTMQEWRRVEEIGRSVTNETLRNTLLRGGYKQVSLKNGFIADVDGLQYPVFAKRLDKATLETLQGTFYEYFDKGTNKGVLIYPSMKAPFKSLDDVEVYKLANPVFDKFNQIDFIVVPRGSQNLNITELPTQVLGFRTHAGTEYADKYFVRVPRLAKNSDDQVIAYAKTVTSGKTYKEAESHIKKMQEIFDVMNQAEEGFITAEEADYKIQRIALRGPYVLSGDFSTMEGWKTFLKEHKMEDLLKPDNYKKMKVDQSSYSPFMPVQVSSSPEDSVSVENIYNRYHRGSQPIVNIGYSAEDVRLQSLPEFANATINRISTQQGVGPVYQTAADRFYATYFDLFDKNNLPPNSVEALRNPRRYMDSLALTDKNSKAFEALVFSDMVNAALGQRTLDKTGNRIINRYLTKAIQSDNKLINTVGELLKDKHPMNRLKGLMYQSVFSLRVDQLAVQTALTTIESMGALPKDTSKALAAYYPVAHLIRMLEKGEDITEMAKTMMDNATVLKTVWPGLTAKGLQKMAEEAYRMGVTATQFTDIRGNNMLQTMQHNSMYFFNKGNKISKTLGHITATARQIDEVKKPIEELTSNDWARIALTGDALSGGSSVANTRRALNGPIASTLTMMTTFPLNQMETFVGKSTIGLSKAERARWGLIMLATFGAQTLVDSQTAREWGYKIEDLTGSKEIGDFVSLGWLNYALNTALGRDVDIGRMSPQLFKNVYFDFFRLVTDVGEDSSPFVVNIFKTLGMKSTDAYNYFEDPQEGLPGFKGLSGTDKAKAIGMTILSTIPGAYDVPELWYAYKYDEYINSKGLDLIAPHAERGDVFASRITEWLTGIKDANYAGLTKYATRNYEKKLKEDYEYTKRIATKWMIQGFSEASRGLDAKANDSFLKANHIIAIGAQDLPPAAQQQLLVEINNNALSGMSAPEREILIKRSSPVLQTSPALQEHYNRELQNTFSVEQTPEPSGINFTPATVKKKR